MRCSEADWGNCHDIEWHVIPLPAQHWFYLPSHYRVHCVHCKLRSENRTQSKQQRKNIHTRRYLFVVRFVNILSVIGILAAVYFVPLQVDAWETLDPQSILKILRSITLLACFVPPPILRAIVDEELNETKSCMTGDHVGERSPLVASQKSEIVWKQLTKACEQCTVHLQSLFILLSGRYCEPFLVKLYIFFKCKMVVIMCCRLRQKFHAATLQSLSLRSLIFWHANYTGAPVVHLHILYIYCLPRTGFVLILQERIDIWLFWDKCAAWSYKHLTPFRTKLFDFSYYPIFRRLSPAINYWGK